MASPFRCMDEFNVFMDAFNEKISIQLLVQSATKNKRVQHLFLLPELNVHQLRLEGNPHIKVHRLKAVLLSLIFDRQMMSCQFCMSLVLISIDSLFVLFLLARCFDHQS